MSEIKLKPCPFCGSTNLKMQTAGDERLKVYTVDCKSCYSCGPMFTNPVGAKKLWNERK